MKIDTVKLSLSTKDRNIDSASFLTAEQKQMLEIQKTFASENNSSKNKEERTSYER